VTELRFHPAARVELVEAIVYHEATRPGYGAEFEAEVDDLVARILEFPESGAPLPAYPPEFDVRAFRLPSFRYSLLVADVDGERMVYAVAHQHRRPGYWRDRLK
jgi:plasmid stabilization system protein ParE